MQTQLGKPVKTEAELGVLLRFGVFCFAYWRQRGCTFQTEPGLVLAVCDGKVLIQHWKKQWFRFDDPVFEIRQH